MTLPMSLPATEKQHTGNGYYGNMATLVEGGAILRGLGCLKSIPCTIQELPRLQRILIPSICVIQTVLVCSVCTAVAQYTIKT